MHLKVFFYMVVTELAVQHAQTFVHMLVYYSTVPRKYMYKHLAGTRVISVVFMGMANCENKEFSQRMMTFQKT